MEAEVYLIATVGLGGALLVSALPKLRRPERFVIAVADYEILGLLLSRIYATCMPPI